MNTNRTRITAPTVTAFLLATALAACGGGSQTTAPPATAPTSSTGTSLPSGVDLVAFTNTPTPSATPTTTTTSRTTTTTATTTPPPALVRCELASDALFAPGDAALTTSARDRLLAVISGVTNIRSIRIEGHTDHVGSDETNLALSRRRAKAAAAVFTAAGIDPALITAVGLGETEANQPGPGRQPTTDQMAHDRRVDILLDADMPANHTC